MLQCTQEYDSTAADLVFKREVFQLVRWILNNGKRACKSSLEILTDEGMVGTFYINKIGRE